MPPTTHLLDPLTAPLLTPVHRALLGRVDALAEDGVRERAGEYDRMGELPEEDLRALQREGWLLANLPTRYGGLGYGIGGDDPLAFYLLVEGLARASASTAHCFQVHNHTLQMLGTLGTPAQLARWLAPTRQRGALLVGAGAEPAGAPPTTAVPVQGGYRVTGTKHYATNAPRAHWIWCVATEEASGQRIMLMLHRDTPGLEIDATVWRPTGMRGCVSPTLRLGDCPVPATDVLGQPGEWLTGHWLALFNLGFAANYLGNAQGMYDWLVSYAKGRTTVDDPFKQAHVGELKTRIDATRLLLYHTALLFADARDRALLASLEVKWMAQETLGRLIQLSGDVAGSTAFFQDHPLERFVRDMQLHLTHSRQIVSAQVVGAAELGAPYNVDRQR